MAITVSNVGTQGMHSSNRLESTAIVSVTGDASTYATGGYTGFAAAVASYLPNGATIIGCTQMSFASGYRVYWNRASDALLFAAANGTEASAGANLSAVTVELQITFV